MANSYEDEAIDSDRLDADTLLSELQAAGRNADQKYRRMEWLRDIDLDPEGAAEICPHGWIYPLDSRAAVEMRDPSAGQPGVRCQHCGSIIDRPPYEGPVTVLYPCQWIPRPITP